MKCVPHILIHESHTVSISAMSNSFHNIVSYSVNGRAPEEILLGKAPGTHPSLVHPHIAQEMSVPTEDTVGSQSPGTFVDGQVVYLRDLHPSATGRWAHANIVNKLEPLAYEVDILIVIADKLM